MTEALAYCLTVECSEADVEAVEGQSFCPKCINKLTHEGWKLSPNGSRVNKGTGVRVSGNGTVTITARYNARMLALMAGEISVDDLDDEELARGMTRGPDGEIPKRQPNMVPKAMYDKMQKLLFERSDDLLKDSLLAAAMSIAKIASDDNVDPANRFKAATWLFERLRGKTPDVLQVNQEKPYEVLIGKVERGPRPPVASPLIAE